jgi:hypothetical protein
VIPRFALRPYLGSQSGQAALLLLGVIAALLAGVLILFGFGQPSGRAASSSVQPISRRYRGRKVMSREYERLFEPAFLEDEVPMPAYASGGGYDGPLAYRMGKPRSHLFPG